MNTVELLPVPCPMCGFVLELGYSPDAGFWALCSICQEGAPMEEMIARLNQMQAASGKEPRN